MLAISKFVPLQPAMESLSGRITVMNTLKFMEQNTLIRITGLLLSALVVFPSCSRNEPQEPLRGRPCTQSPDGPEGERTVTVKDRKRKLSGHLAARPAPASRSLSLPKISRELNRRHHMVPVLSRSLKAGTVRGEDDERRSKDPDTLHRGGRDPEK